MQSEAVVESMPTEILLKAPEVAKHYGMAGYCGRGVWTVLDNLGYGKGLYSADGQDWESGLFNAGWKPFACPSPDSAPFGSVLVYMSDIRRYGHNFVGTKGGRFGHVELVALDHGGNRVYVSDAARARPGGSVPLNFTRRAWVPPDYFASGGQCVLHPSAYDPSLIKKDADALLEERLELAASVFSRPVSVAAN